MCPDHLVGCGRGATEVGGSAPTEDGVIGCEEALKLPSSLAFPFSCHVKLLCLEVFKGRGSSSPMGGPWQSHLPSGQVLGVGIGVCSLALGRTFDAGHLGNMDS